MPFPTPDQVKAIIPPASASWCTKLLALPMRLAFLALQSVTFMVKPNGDPTDEFKEWIGIASDGPVPTPTNLRASQGTSVEVKLTWNASPGALSYVVYRRTDLPATGPVASDAIQTISALAYDDVSAQPGTTYNYWVQAVTTAGQSGFSAPATGWSSNTTVPPGGGGGPTGNSQTFDSSTTSWPILVAGQYTVDAWGGGGGGGAKSDVGFGAGISSNFVGTAGGGGGHIGATFNLAVGEVLQILIGGGGQTGSLQSVAGAGNSTVVNVTHVNGQTEVLLTAYPGQAFTGHNHDPIGGESVMGNVPPVGLPVTGTGQTGEAGQYFGGSIPLTQTIGGLAGDTNAKDPTDRTVLQFGQGGLGQLASFTSATPPTPVAKPATPGMAGRVVIKW